MVEIIYLFAITRESLYRSGGMISGFDFLSFLSFCFFCLYVKWIPEQISVRLPVTIMLSSLNVLLGECIVNAFEIYRKKTKLLVLWSTYTVIQLFMHSGNIIYLYSLESNTILNTKIVFYSIYSKKCSILCNYLICKVIGITDNKKTHNVTPI